MLDGVLDSPADHTAKDLPIDACLLTHGTGSNFYAPGVLETFAGQAVQAGITALRINTRGHDGMSTIPARGGSVHGGATYETVADCRHDLAAWINLLVSRGFSRIALVGHSMGGVKSIYTMAHDSHPSVKAVITISSPRFCHARLAAHASGAEFLSTFQRARELVEQGQPETLLPVCLPMPFVATAAGYVEKYGPQDHYDYVKFLPRVSRPVLVIVGSETVATSAAFAELPQTLAELSPSLPHVRCEVVEGANINYSGCRHVPFERAIAWLRNI